MVRKHGHHFHTLYWTLLELLHCHGVGDTLKIDWRDLADATQIRTSKLRSCLDDSEASSKVIVTSSRDHVEIQIPKCRERWSKQKSNLPRKKRQPSVNLPIEVEVDKEKHTHGEFVRLTIHEHTKLVTQFGQRGTTERIANLDHYLGSKGVKYKSHYHTILSWERKNGAKPEGKRPEIVT